MSCRILKFNLKGVFEGASRGLEKGDFLKFEFKGALKGLEGGLEK